MYTHTNQTHTYVHVHNDAHTLPFPRLLPAFLTRMLKSWIGAWGQDIYHALYIVHILETVCICSLLLVISFHPRLCTLTVTRLEVIRPFESGHGSIVMAASMKTPHRHLRSNEIKLRSDGLLDIPLQLTFCLQV